MNDTPIAPEAAELAAVPQAEIDAAVAGASESLAASPLFNAIAESGVTLPLATPVPMAVVDPATIRQPYPFSQAPSLGRIVHYRLTRAQCDEINARRKVDGITPTGGAMRLHEGNPAYTVDPVPMLIVRCWGDTPGSYVNGQAFLDGNDVLWVTSAQEGDEPGTWSWPPRV